MTRADPAEVWVIPASHACHALASLLRARRLLTHVILTAGPEMVLSSLTLYRCGDGGAGRTGDLFKVTHMAEPVSPPDSLALEPVSQCFAPAWFLAKSLQGTESANSQRGHACAGAQGGPV